MSWECDNTNISPFHNNAIEPIILPVNNADLITENLLFNSLALDNIKLDELINVDNINSFEVISKYPELEEYIFTNEPKSQCDNIIITIMALRLRLGYKLKLKHPLYTLLMGFNEHIILPNITIVELQELINALIYISLLIFQDNEYITQQTKLKLMKKMCKYIIEY
jgi:hypothetical protein